jgi:hypothetical protein
VLCPAWRTPRRRHRRSADNRIVPSVAHVGYHDSRAFARPLPYRLRQSRMSRLLRSQSLSRTRPMGVSLARILIVDALLSGRTTRVGLRDDPLYFINADAKKLGDLRLRHAIVCQRADAPELRGGYRAGVAPDCPPQSCRFRLGRRFYLWRFHWRRRQDTEDTRLASRLRLGGRDGVFGRHCRVGRPRLWPRRKEVFRILSRSVDLFAINASVRRPFARQALLP